MGRARVISISVFFAVSALLQVKAHAHPAWGIVVDRQGQVYFSDLKTVWKINAQGKLAVFRAEDGRHTHDLNIDGAGNIYGADNSYDPATKRFFSAIWKMTSAGSFSYLLAPTDNPPIGTSIWKDREGNMYRVDYYPERQLLILKRTPNDKVIVLTGNSNAIYKYHQGVPYSVGGMAFGPDGALYFTHGSNVSKLTTTGTLTALARNVTVENASDTAAGGSPLFGIVVDAQGNAFVADFGNRRLLKITPNNQITTLIQAEPTWFPTGVALSGNDLFILEIRDTPTHTLSGTRVRKLSPDGTVKVLASVGENMASSGNTSAGETSSDDNSKSIAKHKGINPYPLVATAIVGLVLTSIVVGYVSRRTHRHQHRNDEIGPK